VFIVVYFVNRLNPETSGYTLVFVASGALLSVLLDGGELSAPHFGLFILGEKAPGPHWKGG
jgi:hypothetical protein